MAVLPSWVRIPSGWIDSFGLSTFRWGPDGKGANNIAALMCLAVIAHHADQSTGLAQQLTYDQLEVATGLSRTKISQGLNVLSQNQLISRSPDGRSTYRLTDFDPKRGWAKLPARKIYASGCIPAFQDMKLRRISELDGLKLYFLFAARRNRETNLANISLDKIELYTGIERSRIKTATSWLASLPLVYVEQLPSRAFEKGVSNAYRLVGLDSYNHMGTRGRTLLSGGSIQS